MAIDPQVFVSGVVYKDPRAAVAWLAGAFGFELTMAIEAPDGDPATSHYEMAAEGGRGRLMVGAEWKATMRSPASLEGANTQSIHVEVVGDVDAHCARARAAGARIVMEPQDEFYGDRNYRAADLEGHEWVFFAHVREVSRAEAEAAIGTPITSSTWS